jgi:hypothetical protein
MAENPWVQPSRHQLPELPARPHPDRVEAEILEMRRHYQALLAYLLPEYHSRVVPVQVGQLEGAIFPWAQRIFFNFSKLSALPLSIAIDTMVVYPAATSRPVISLPCRRAKSWEVDWGTAAPQGFSILYTSDVRDEVFGI